MVRHTKESVIFDREACGDGEVSSFIIVTVGGLLFWAETDWKKSASKKISKVWLDRYKTFMRSYLCPQMRENVVHTVNLVRPSTHASNAHTWWPKIDSIHSRDIIYRYEQVLSTDWLTDLVKLMSKKRRCQPTLLGWRFCEGVQEGLFKGCSLISTIIWFCF